MAAVINNQPSKSYDFSSIFMNQQDIKSSFRNLQLQQDRFEKNLHKSHDKYFKTLIKEKKKKDDNMITSENFNGFSNNYSGADNKNILTNSKIAKNHSIEYMNQKDNNFEGNVLIENQLTFIEVDDFKKHKLQQQLQFQLQLHQFMKRKLPGNLNEKNNDTSSPFKGRASIVHHSGGLNIANAFSGMDEVTYMMKFKEQILEPEERALFIREDYNSEELHIARDLLCDQKNDLRSVKIHEFRRYMRNDQILEHTARYLYDSILFKEQSDFSLNNSILSRNQHFQTNMNEIKDLLKTMDKYLFVMFRNQEITLDQLKARLAEKNLGVKYTVLDDLRDTLQPEILEGVSDEVFHKLYKTEKDLDGKIIVPLKEMQKDLQPWQTDNHCLRSLFYEKKKDFVPVNFSLASQSPLKKHSILEAKKRNEDSRVQRRNDQSRIRDNKSQNDNTSKTRMQTNQVVIKSRNKNEDFKKNNTTNNVLMNQTQGSTQSHSSAQKGVTIRSPAKFQGRDYKQFLSQMTKKIKIELKKEVSDRDNRQKREILKEYQSTTLENYQPNLIDQVLNQHSQSISPSKLKNFNSDINQSNKKSYAIKSIRDKLNQEGQRVQGMLFLKQLELEGKGQVVWEKSTLKIMRQIEEEKHKMEHTDYEKALKPRKPRPKELIRSSPQKQNKTYAVVKRTTDSQGNRESSRESQANISSQDISVSPIKQLGGKSHSLIKIEEESISQGERTNIPSKLKIHAHIIHNKSQMRNETMEIYESSHSTLLADQSNKILLQRKNQQQNYNSQPLNQNNYMINSQYIKNQNDNSTGKDSYNFMETGASTSKLVKDGGKFHIYNTQVSLLNNRNEKNLTTATSITNDEHLISNINSNRSLLLRNPPKNYQPINQSLNHSNTYNQQSAGLNMLNNSSNNCLRYSSNYSFTNDQDSYPNLKNAFPLRNQSQNQLKKGQNIFKQKAFQKNANILVDRKPQTAEEGYRNPHRQNRNLKEFRITQRLADVLVSNDIPLQLNQEQDYRQQEIKTDFKQLNQRLNPNETQKTIYSQNSNNNFDKTVSTGSLNFYHIPVANFENQQIQQRLEQSQQKNSQKELLDQDQYNQRQYIDKNSLGIITGSAGIANDQSIIIENSEMNGSVDEGQLMKNKFMISRFKRKELQCSLKKSRLY
ncbi:UNKNOWN [Stylonychia lemnae]|uniref:Uncharacterized protein n=1 Tax=Stylonychia lemnae TaxID=5949 RepID=A0A078BF49_STYLE|nr:UNKNOWN [Stylonychia lemnae]|eukprot:CDW91772.1 UNKNOWN [Stylonychia lemnae]